MFATRYLQPVRRQLHNTVQRYYSASAAAAAPANTGSFKHSNLTIEKTTAPKTRPENDSLVFGKNFTDHMLEVEWDAKTGWGAPRIVPYHNLSLPPSVSSLHYALQCFEGMKAYKDATNTKTFMFRPEMNGDRMNRSCQRLSLPTFDRDEWVKCIAELVRLDSDWIPQMKGHSLYIRPTVISTDDTLGVSPPQKALFYTIAGPVGPYFRSGFAPVKLYANPKYVRAYPGGTGASKIGSNYAPTILPQLEAVDKGYSQVLWLYGPEHELAEVGTMNIFFFEKDAKTGKPTLVTPPLDGTILPGVTRNSVMEIVKGWGIDVQERRITMKDVISSVDEGRALEAFGAGTACIVTPVSTIHFEGRDIEIPIRGEDGLTLKLFNHILSIQHGETDSPYAIEVNDFLEGQKKN